MKEKDIEALNVLKAVIDQATGLGLFKTIDTAVRVQNAYQYISTELQGRAAMISELQGQPDSKEGHL